MGPMLSAGDNVFRTFFRIYRPRWPSWTALSSDTEIFVSNMNYLGHGSKIIIPLPSFILFLLFKITLQTHAFICKMMFLFEQICRLHFCLWYSVITILFGAMLLLGRVYSSEYLIIQKLPNILGLLMDGRKILIIWREFYP